MNIKKMKFVDYISVFFKGLILGLVSLGVPGLSASTMGIIVGIYFLMVESIANLFKDFKHNGIFLLDLFLGYAAGSLIAAFSITIFFEKFPLVTTCVIIAIILGSVVNMIDSLKEHFKSVANWVVFFAVFAFLIGYNQLIAGSTSLTFPSDPNLRDLILMLIIGLITSTTFIIPGVDFAVVFLSIGIYYPFMNMLASIVSFGSPDYFQTLLPNLEILGAYMVGYYLGVFLFSKLIKFLIGKYEVQTQFASLAFVVAAPPVFLTNCVIDNPSFFMTVPHWVVGIILGLLALLAMIAFEKYGKHHARKLTLEKQIADSGDPKKTIQDFVDKHAEDIQNKVIAADNDGKRQDE